jgi:hypothetical protein
MLVFAGKPARVKTNVAFAAVIVLAESRVRSSVNRPVPLPVESAFVIGGTSFAGLSAAVKLIVFAGPDGAAGMPLAHPAARRATAVNIANLFISIQGKGKR